MPKKFVYIDANGREVEKITKPYGSAPKAKGKFKRGKHVRRDTIRYAE